MFKYILLFLNCRRVTKDDIQTPEVERHFVSFCFMRAHPTRLPFVFRFKQFQKFCEPLWCLMCSLVAIFRKRKLSKVFESIFKFKVVKNLRLLEAVLDENKIGFKISTIRELNKE